MIEAKISSTAKRRLDRRQLLFMIFSFCMVATLSFLIIRGVKTVDAGRLDNFRAGNIISDYVMSNYKSMTESEIQNFLKSKNSCNNTNTYLAQRYPQYQYHIENGHFVCMADERFGGETAAHIIWQAAQDYRINPQVLIVLLQKEQSLVTDTWPNHVQYRAATGYGCPDTAACSEKYYGFKNQVRRAAEMFRTVLNGGWTNYPLGNNYVQYNPNKACGGTTVYIENLATSALYRYTPYQPNAAAKAAGYGQGDGCSAYGNRNFYLYFLDWFGNPQGFSATYTTLPEDDYYLVLDGDYTKVLQTDTPSKDNGIKFMMASRNTADTFRLSKNSDGTYTLLDLYSNKVIDVPSAKAYNGAHLQQYESNSSDAQKWRLYDNGDGTYSIGSALNRELVLTIDTDEDSTTFKRLILGYYNYSPHQSFRFVQIKQPVEDGEYYLTSGLSKGFTLDVSGGSSINGANIQIYTQNFSDAQAFKFTFDKNTGYYQIVNTNAELNMDVAGAKTANRTNVQIYAANNSCAQQWQLLKHQKGGYEIISACSGKALDVSDGIVALRTNVQIYQRNNSTAQAWTLMEDTPLLKDGSYYINSALRDDFNVDVQSGRTSNATNVWAYTYNGSYAQEWEVTYDKQTKFYRIVNPFSQKALDVSAASTLDRANVQIYDDNGSCAQQWKIIPIRQNLYEIISACSGKALDVSGGKSIDRTNIQIFTRNFSAAQLWAFTTKEE